MKTDLFQSCGNYWVFQICWHIECSSLAASSFRILNSSAEIPSLPLALFLVMLPKAHFLRSRMSGFRWVITLSWFCGSLRSFLCSYSVYNCHLYLISSASIRSILFLSNKGSLHETFPWSPIFLKDLESFPFCCFPLFLCIVRFRRLSYLSLLYSGTELCNSVLYIFPFLPCSLLLFFPQLFASLLRQRLCFLAFLFLWDGFGDCLLYNVMTICPWFFRHSVYQM